ncbi:MAG: hypothetical protein M0Z96_02875, partial [Actinomycetota bacterium]|nr:hypothetical protein [Actinomycetota bacterium]
VYPSFMPCEKIALHSQINLTFAQFSLASNRNPENLICQVIPTKDPTLTVSGLLIPHFNRTCYTIVMAIFGLNGYTFTPLVQIS